MAYTVVTTVRESTCTYVPQSKAAILLPKLAADDLTELVELDGKEDSHCSRSGVVDLDCHSGLGEGEGENGGSCNMNTYTVVTLLVVCFNIQWNLSYIKDTLNKGQSTTI